MSFDRGLGGSCLASSPFACFRRVESGAEDVVSYRSNGPTPLEVPELDNNDISLLDETADPFNYKRTDQDPRAWVIP